MQSAIEQLVRLGSFPKESEASEVEINRLGDLLDQIESPVSDDEARALSALFGVGSCYGLAWSVLHAIETAPGWPLSDVLRETETENEWIEFLRVRVQNAGLATESE